MEHKPCYALEVGVYAFLFKSGLFCSATYVHTVCTATVKLAWKVHGAVLCMHV